MLAVQLVGSQRGCFQPFDHIRYSKSCTVKMSLCLTSGSESESSPEKRVRLGEASCSEGSPRVPKQKNRRRCHSCQTKLELVQQELGSCRCGQYHRHSVSLKSAYRVMRCNKTALWKHCSSVTSHRSGSDSLLSFTLADILPRMTFIFRGVLGPLISHLSVCAALAISARTSRSLQNRKRIFNPPRPFKFQW